MRRPFCITLIILLIGTGTGLAVSAGNVLEFNKSPMGLVKFDGQIHKDAGNKCKDCHNNDMFPKMKQGTVNITMEEIYAGRLCGVCHNGQRAFDAKGNCQRCHVKQ